MSLQNQPNMESQAENTPEQRVSHSRRKFLVQASAVSLPMIAAMKSGDAWGCVPLNCEKGEGSLSGTRSAVASASKLQDYRQISPIFESVDTIIRVVEVDLGYKAKDSIPGYLWSHYRNLATRSMEKKTWVYTLVRDDLSRSDITKVTKSHLASWSSACKQLSTDGLLYNKSTGAKVKFYPNWPLITPLEYNGVLIHGETKMSQFFPNIPTSMTVLSCLRSNDDFYKYVTAAFIGSLWQNCYIWWTGYASTDVKNHKFDCYPLVTELMKSYDNVRYRNPKLRNITESQALLDMGRVFRAYTKGAF